MIIPEIYRVRVTVRGYVLDNLSQSEAEEIISNCLQSGERPQIKVWFFGNDFAKIRAWVEAMIPPVPDAKTTRHYETDLARFNA